jgi:hypothetical protein
MADLGTVGVRSTAVLTGNVLLAVTLAGGVPPAPTPYPDVATPFPDQSQPQLTTFPPSRVQLGF